MICRICGNSENNQAYKVEEMLFGFRDKFDYYQCASCDCLQISEIPQDMLKYYRNDYYSYNFKMHELKKTKNILLRYLKEARKDYAIFNKGLLGHIIYAISPASWLKECLSIYFPGMPIEKIIAKNSTILDVGCGNGKLLYLLNELGFRHAMGIDPYGKDIAYPNGLHIYKKNIHDLDEGFDLIMFHHSFEHVADPIDTIRHVARLLTKNGKCVIRIPTVDSFAWRHYRQNWVSLDAPRHFHLFSKKSIELLADKAELELIKVVYDSSEWQFWGSEQYIKGIPMMTDQSYSIHKENSIFLESDITAYKKEAQRLNAENQGDTAAYYLRKR